MQIDLVEGDVIYLNHSTGFRTTSPTRLLDGYYTVLRRVAKCRVGAVYELRACSRTVVAIAELGVPYDPMTIYLAKGRILGKLLRDKVSVEVFEVDWTKRTMAMKFECTVGSSAFTPLIGSET